MSVQKKYSQKLFGMVTFLSALIAAGIGCGMYYGIRWIGVLFSGDLAQEELLKNLKWILTYVAFADQNFYKIVLPATAAAIFILGWLIWLVLKLFTMRGLDKSDNSEVPEEINVPGKKDFIAQKIEQEKKQRLFLHSLSVFQREGRLLDFFDEDLSLYSDDQIGAAVRSIQEDCKKTLKKYISPRPVVEEEEGESITVEKGFDIDSIKLVGNVSGEPPFKGVVKHRGWKAGKKELPKLTQVQDPSVMAPAEIEIQ